MTKTSTVAEWALPWDGEGDASGKECATLTIAWCLESPARVGETARLDGAATLGRGDADSLGFYRERPNSRTGGEPVNDARISRRQLTLEPHSDGRVAVRNVGKCPLLVNGEPVTSASVLPGDTIALQNALVLLVGRRTPPVPLRSYPAELAFPFGAPDAHGILGESPAIWRLRDELAFIARAAAHVLVQGKSGAGKELAARAIHALSSRAHAAFLARNAATFPDALIDAELFGNAKNYPNPGMPERRGLIGEANGATLFLDEIGELPPGLQAHLLRVLDRDGEYQRLGDPAPSRSDLRIIAATNRALDELKHDFVARFTARVEVPELDRRREDIPLLVRHVLERAAASDARLGARFFDRGSAGPAGARIDPMLIERLLRHPYTHELRELERLVWLSLSTSTGRFIAATPEVLRELGTEQEPPAASPPAVDRAAIETALASCSGSVTRAARELGLKSRFQLYRLMRRHGIDPSTSGKTGDGDDG